MDLKMEIVGLLNQYEHGKFSNILLNDFFRDCEEEFEGLMNKEKGFIAEVFYGVIRNVIFLDYQINKRVKKIDKLWVRNLLRLSIYQIEFMRGDNSGVVYEAVEVGKERGGTFIGSFINGVLRSYLREREDELEKLKKDNDIATLYSYPQWFVDEIKWEQKENYIDILKSFKKIPNLSIKYNKIKFSKEEFDGFLVGKRIEVVKRVDNIYYIKGGKVLGMPEFKKGLITVQDGASYLAAKFVEAKPGERVLDMCSAPGGKSIAMAEMMENQGEIVALDIHEHKLKLINSRSRQMGINIIETNNLDGRKVEETYGGESFDKVLVDAPCSGFGVIRKKPEVLYRKTMKTVQELSKLQLELLEAGGKVVKKGGTLVYSTCTILNKENIENVRKFLNKNPDFIVEELELPHNVTGKVDKLGGLTIFDDYLDGFYIIRFRKK